MRMRLRRNQNYLVIIGTGVIVFGIWSVIKAVMFLVLGGQDISGFFSDVQLSGMPIRMGYLSVVGLLAVELAARMIVGLCARAEGYGRKMGNGYVLLAIALSVFHLLAVVTGISSRFRFYDSPADGLVSLLMDLTSLITLIEMVNSVFKVRWLSRELSLSE